MADLDNLVDKKGFIIHFIEEQARDLFYGETTPYDFPAWAQTALLFEHTITPCRYHPPESLLELAQKVITTAKSKGCVVEMHQVKNGKKVNAQVFDYHETIAKIEQWFKKETELIEMVNQKMAKKSL
ncbi:MAG: hypothetical protein ACFFDN_20680 [Candidatus Hodarchaeota archaeon]